MQLQETTPAVIQQTAYGSDLTTTKAAIIEEAKASGEIYLPNQPYELYSENNQEAWRLLCQRQKQLWREHACADFANGVETLQINAERVPRLEEINDLLFSATGFLTRPVSGYIPAYRFFQSLSERKFPCTITIRALDKLDYLSEPDMFHDIHGHVPMFANPNFADFLARFGRAATAAADFVADIADETERIETLSSILRGLSRFFWFTIEFGLIRENGQLKAYGGGLLSSAGELVHALKSPSVRHYPFQLEWVINQGFDYTRYQPILFYIDSLAQLEQFVTELEVMIVANRLSNLAPGEPEISREDLLSFLQPAQMPN